MFPPPSRFAEVTGSAFSVAIVSFAVSISMGRLFAKKHNYHLDDNQVERYHLSHVCICNVVLHEILW